MQILKAGTKIKTVIGDIEGMIIGVIITMDLVEYKIRYFSSGQEHITWLHRYEIEVFKSNSKVGFGVKRDDDPDPNIILIEQP